MLYPPLPVAAKIIVPQTVLIRIGHFFQARFQNHPLSRVHLALEN